MGNIPPNYVVQSGEQFEQKSVSFRADQRNALVSIKSTKGPNAKFIISIMDTDSVNPISLRFWPYRFEMMVERAEGHLKVRYAKTCVTPDNIIFGVYALAKVGFTAPLVNLYEEDVTMNRKMTTAEDGGIVETSVNPYRVRGRDNQRGLMVIEWKKKAWNQNPYVVTVSHYFASLGENNNDKGFSVVARIRGVDGADDVQVEGPERHPGIALFEMFNEVLRSGRWTPNACPHCSANYANNNAAAYAIPRAPGETAKDHHNPSPTAGLQSSGENDNAAVKAFLRANNDGGIESEFKDDNRHSDGAVVQDYIQRMLRSKAVSKPQVPSDKKDRQKDTSSPLPFVVNINNNVRTGPGPNLTGKDPPRTPNLM